MQFVGKIMHWKCDQDIKYINDKILLASLVMLVSLITHYFDYLKTILPSFPAITFQLYTNICEVLKKPCCLKVKHIIISKVYTENKSNVYGQQNQISSQ